MYLSFTAVLLHATRPCSSRALSSFTDLRQHLWLICSVQASSDFHIRFRIGTAPPPFFLINPTMNRLRARQLESFRGSGFFFSSMVHFVTRPVSSPFHGFLYGQKKRVRWMALCRPSTNRNQAPSNCFSWSSPCWQRVSDLSDKKGDYVSFCSQGFKDPSSEQMGLLQRIHMGLLWIVSLRNRWTTKGRSLHWTVHADTAGFYFEIQILSFF